MRYFSYVHDGQERFGCLVGDGICDLAELSGLPDLKTYIAVNADRLGREEGLEPVLGLKAVTFLPVIPNPSKVLCVATNYIEPGDEQKERPEYPLTFTRFGVSQTGHGQPLRKPGISQKFDYEGELAVIIAKPGHRISEADALSHVAGYSCFNDGSVRDWQKHSSQFTPGKNFIHTAGFGPWMVSADELPDPGGLELRTRVNGELRQQNNTSRMIFSVPQLISYFSQFTMLEPGDVLVTGTPSGFGSTRKPPVFLNSGDIVEVEIDGIGTLRNPVGSSVPAFC